MRELINFATRLFAVAVTALIPIAQADEERPVLAVKRERLTILAQDRPLDRILAEISRGMLAPIAPKTSCVVTKISH